MQGLMVFNGFDNGTSTTIVFWILVWDMIRSESIWWYIMVHLLYISKHTIILHVCIDTILCVMKPPQCRFHGTIAGAYASYTMWYNCEYTTSMYGHSFRAMYEQLPGYSQPASPTDRPKRDEAELQRFAGVAWVLFLPRIFLDQWRFGDGTPDEQSSLEFFRCDCQRYKSLVCSKGYIDVLFVA